MHWIEKFPSPIIFGHRGASQVAPENTITAFELALKHGAEAIELDARLSADGIPMVIHDRTVDRTTNGFGKVDQISTHELRKLDAGAKFPSKYSHEKIPLLEEVFITFKNRALINVELKNNHNLSDILPEIVIELTNKLNMLDQTLFSSNFPASLKRIKQLDSHAHVALICSQGILGYLLRSKLFSSVSPDYIHPNFNDISMPFIERQHRMNRKVNIWTANQKRLLIRLINLGVDGIITDNPKLAYKLKREMRK